MEQAWDDLVAEYPNSGIQYYINVDPDTGAKTTTYGAFCQTPPGRVVVEKPTASEAVTILSSAVLGSDTDEAMQTLVKRSESAANEADAKREYDRAQYYNAA